MEDYNVWLCLNEILPEIYLNLLCILVVSCIQLHERDIAMCHDNLRFIWKFTQELKPCWELVERNFKNFNFRLLLWDSLIICWVIKQLYCSIFAEYRLILANSVETRYIGLVDKVLGDIPRDFAGGR